MDVASLGGERETAQLHVFDHAAGVVVSCDGSLDIWIGLLGNNLIQCSSGASRQLPQRLPNRPGEANTAKRLSCVLGMLSSLEVKVLCPT